MWKKKCDVCKTHMLWVSLHDLTYDLQCIQQDKQGIYEAFQWGMK